jgi:hypothetical protein
LQRSLTHKNPTLFPSGANEILLDFLGTIKHNFQSRNRPDL